MNEEANALRIEQLIRLTRATLEVILGKDSEAKCLMDVNVSNIEESQRAMLDVIEQKVKNVFEDKFIH